MKLASIHALRTGWFDHLPLKAFSLLLAVGLFFAVRRESETRTVLLVRVAYRLPAERELVGDHPSHLKITVQGPREQIARLDERELGPVELDLRQVTSGPLRLRSSMIHLPVPLRIVTISPSVLPVRFEPKIRRLLPVRAVLAGEPAPGFRVGAVHTSPATVEVEGPARALRAADAVETEPLRIAGARAAVARQVALHLPGELHLLSPVREVQVKLDVARAIDERPLVGRPIEVAAATGVALAISPAQADVVLMGPRSAIDRIDPNDLRLQVDLRHVVGRRGSGSASLPQRAEVRVTGLPAGVAAEVHPDWVEVSSRSGR